MSSRKPLSSIQERSPLYEDVRSLLNPGFLSISLKFNGVSLSLRTLNSDDLVLIEARSGLNGDDWYDWLLASSIWVFNGQVLERDQGTLFYLFSEIKKFPREIKGMMITATAILTKRFVRSKEKALSYYYERESRDLWGSRGDTLFNNVFSWVGRNTIQDLWVYYNKMEDLRMEQVFSQNLAAFGASPHAPKSVKKIFDRMKADEEYLEIDRSIVQDKMYFDHFGITFEDSRFLRRGFGLVEVATTFEELEEQFKNSIEGKKDRHDLAIDDARRRLVAKKEARRRQREERIRELQKKRAERLPQTTEGPTMLVGSEAEEYLREMNEEAARYRVGWISEPDDVEKSFSRHIESEVQRPEDLGKKMSKEEEETVLSWMSSGNRDLTKDLEKRKPSIG